MTEVIMSPPPKPRTLKETVDQVWWVLIGSNGDGVVSKVNTIRNDLDTVLSSVPTLATKAELDATIQAHEGRDISRRAKAIEDANKKKEHDGMTLREWLSAVGTIGSFLWPIVVAIWLFLGGKP